MHAQYRSQRALHDLKKGTELIIHSYPGNDDNDDNDSENDN